MMLTTIYSVTFLHNSIYSYLYKKRVCFDFFDVSKVKKLLWKFEFDLNAFNPWGLQSVALPRRYGLAIFCWVRGFRGEK